MRQTVVRLAAVLVLALSLAAAAVAEEWSFGHFAETSGSTTTQNSFDSVLYLANKPGSLHRCWIILLDEAMNNLKVNGQDVCPDIPSRAQSPCLANVFGFFRFKIQDRIVAVAGTTWPVALGQVRVRCEEPLADLNATLWVTNYRTSAFDATFTVDAGKILP